MSRLCCFPQYFSLFIIFLCRLNLPNLKDVCLPVDDTNNSINSKLKEKLESGEITLGELIVPQTFTKLSLINNELVSEEITMEGQKIPLYDIRKSMLEDKAKFMRLRTDLEFEKLPRDEIIDNLTAIHEFKPGDECRATEVLLARLKCFEHTRHLMTWHDCSTIASHSHFLVMVNSM